ncbi:MAG: DUF2808 domain-containing protein [Cyanobium sp. PLM2.Bin73]|nr:MAG: DUF2808 domain-containing protein [Cyanobium sp. PLM2.Bin73]
MGFPASLWPLHLRSAQASPPRGHGRDRRRRLLALLAASLGLGVAGLAAPLPAVLAQGTPSLLEFRWENNRDFRRLFFFVSSTERSRRAEYFLILRPRDRNNAILKLTVTVPEHFNARIDNDRVRLCTMREGGMLARTRCLDTIPATIEISENGRAIDIFPDTPVADNETIGVNMRLFNPSNAGMFQFNALAQAPGDVPVSGYLGSWVIQIDP